MEDRVDRQGGKRRQWPGGQVGPGAPLSKLEGRTNGHPPSWPLTFYLVPELLLLTRPPLPHSVVVPAVRSDLLDAAILAVTDHPWPPGDRSRSSHADRCQGNATVR